MIANVIPDPPKEDSEDLSSEEAAKAIPSKGIEDIAARMRQEGPVTDIRHELRRHLGKLFWRIRLGERSLLFEVPWMDRGDAS